jgi:hypothetical protein
MDQSAFQGVEKQMMAFSGFDMFDEKFGFARHGRKFGLFFDQWCQEMKLFFTGRSFVAAANFFLRKWPGLDDKEVCHQASLENGLPDEFLTNTVISLDHHKFEYPPRKNKAFTFFKFADKKYSSIMPM